MKEKSKKFILLTGDIILLYLGMYVGFLSRNAQPPSFALLQRSFLPFAVTFIIWILIFYSQKLYDFFFLKRKVGYYENLFKAVLLNSLFGFALFYLLPYFPFAFLKTTIAPKTILVLTALNGAVLIHLWRQLFGFVVFTQPSARKIFLASGDERLISALKEIDKNSHFNFQIYTPKQEKKTEEQITTNDINLVLYPSTEEGKKFIQNLSQKILNKAHLRTLSSFYEQRMHQIPFQLQPHTKILESIARKENSLYQLTKRIADIIAAVLIGLFFFPLVPFIVLAIKLEDQGPVLFTQPRVGKYETQFRLFKFRTMSPKPKDKTDDSVWTQSEDKRITKVGKFLRLTHLDEYPQIINILKGDMSLVGPRPERPPYVKRLKQETSYYSLRHLVKPGLTGWAQIHYLYGDSVETNLEKLKYDLYYIKNRSFFFDFTITLKTASIVLGTQGR